MAGSAGVAGPGHRSQCGFEDSGGGCGEMRRWLAAFAWVLGLCVPMGLVLPARAASIPFVPDSYWTVTAGTAADASSMIRGGTIAVTGGTSGFTSGPGLPGSTYLGYRMWVAELVGVDALNGAPILTQHSLGCTTGAANPPNAGCLQDSRVEGAHPSYNLYLNLVCSDAATLNSQKFDVATGLLYGSARSWCDSHGGLAEVSSPGIGGTGAYSTIAGFDYVVGGGLLVTTTTIICLDRDGETTSWQSQTEPGAEAAPLATLCPAGSVPIVVRVVQSDGTVVTDAEISDEALDAWIEYGLDPEGWEYGYTRDGIPCVEGDPVCEGAISGAVPDSSVECVLWGPAGTSGGLYFPQTQIVCLQWASEGQGTGVQPSTSSDVEAPDFGVVTRAIEQMRDAVRRAVDGVKSAVEAASARADAAATGIQSAIESARSDAAAQAEGLHDAIVPDGAAVGAIAAGMGDAAAGAIEPWTSLGSSYAGSFAASGTCSCAGPAITISGHVIYPASACGDRAAFASAVRLMLSGVLVVGAAMTCVGFIMSAIGYAGPGSKAAGDIAASVKGGV